MPYANKEQLKSYQHIWMWRRRLTWILENGPCDCGSTKDLSVVHKDPKEKTVRVTSIWSLSEARRGQELAKCVVLCAACLQAKRKVERNQPAEHGTDRRYGQGCKCYACRRAHAEKSQQYRRARKERGWNSTSTTRRSERWLATTIDPKRSGQLGVICWM